MAGNESGFTILDYWITFSDYWHGIITVSIDMQLENKSTLIIGLGLSGASAAACLLARKAVVYGVDDHWHTLKNNPKIQILCNQGLQILDSNSIPSLQHFDLIVVSPGISKVHCWYKAAIEQGCRIIGEAELAISLLEGQQRWIGITGTNGKTTVTLLIAHILNQNGIPAIAVGNVGKPLTELLLDIDLLTEKTTFVVELSSFQLETIKSQAFDVAVLLNITEDHLDRYESFHEYVKAKIHLFDCVKSEGVCFIDESCLQEFAPLLQNYVLRKYGYKDSCFIYSDLKSIFRNQTNECLLPESLKGQKSHDLENVLVAYAVAREVGLSSEQIIQALLSFKKPPHRLEFVCKWKDVVYIDDSKATNVEAVIRAVESIPQRIILIAGGVDKGGSYLSWQPLFAKKVRFVCVIGQAAENIKKALEMVVPIYHFETLEAAVTYAAKLAEPTEAVVLSPGCSSYDMFSSYAHRGDCFKAIVQDLALRGN